MCVRVRVSLSSCRSPHWAWINHSTSLSCVRRSFARLHCFCHAIFMHGLTVIICHGIHSCIVCTGAVGNTGQALNNSHFNARLRNSIGARTAGTIVRCGMCMWSVMRRVNFLCKKFIHTVEWRGLGLAKYSKMYQRLFCTAPRFHQPKRRLFDFSEFFIRRKSLSTKKRQTKMF